MMMRPLGYADALNVGLCTTVMLKSLPKAISILCVIRLTNGGVGAAPKARIVESWSCSSWESTISSASANNKKRSNNVGSCAVAIIGTAKTTDTPIDLTIPMVQPLATTIPKKISCQKSYRIAGWLKRTWIEKSHLGSLVRRVAQSDTCADWVRERSIITRSALPGQTVAPGGLKSLRTGVRTGESAFQPEQIRTNPNEPEPLK